MRFFKRVNLTNGIFFSIIYISYIIVVVVAYIKNGLYDWNFTNTLPTANVSPFMFGTLFLFYLLPKNVKKYYQNLISLLSIGMLLSPIFAMIFNFYRHYSFHLSFMCDYISHFGLSLWGIYFISSNQIELKGKQSMISSSLIVSVAVIMLVLNIILDKSFFGLSLNGKHNIYNMVIVDNSYLSMLIYFFGLFVVLILGYFYQLVLIKTTHQK